MREFKLRSPLLRHIKLLCFVTVCGFIGLNASAQGKPNILVIFGDDVGQANISRYTHGLMGYMTPNIDKIGAEGMTFTDYYAENSCTAGRSSFITGQSPIRTGLSKVGIPGATVGLHIPIGVACVLAGAIAMLSKKARGRHSTFSTIYFHCLLALFASATFLSLTRWSEDEHLFVLGALSFASAWIGRAALHSRWRHWVRLHITGLGPSYVLLLIAFYVDNGKQLPV